MQVPSTIYYRGRSFVGKYFRDLISLNGTLPSYNTTPPSTSLPRQAGAPPRRPRKVSKPIHLRFIFSKHHQATPSSQPHTALSPTRHIAAMDIALELCDTYAFDYVYSTLLPASPSPYNLNDGFGNATTFDTKAASPWQWQPASQFLSFPPTDAAYMSQWSRDNIYRQFLSLFLIMW